MEHLDQLEAQSIFLFREAYASFKKLCMPWSMGKDSNVLIWLANKAFCGKIPFPLLHIDTTYEFPEMMEFREWGRKHYNLDLIVKINQEALDAGYRYENPKYNSKEITGALKAEALKQILAEHQWDAMFTGIRRDEDPIRAKERYFSPRNANSEWDFKDQPPEFWGQFTTKIQEGEHVRVQPLLDWTELDIWLYIRREKIPIPQMYYARPGKDGKLYRFRSLGCWPITHPVPSNASNIDEVIEELRETRTSERSGRAQDHIDDGSGRTGMEDLRIKGFF